MKQDLDHWISIPVPWLGRISLVKMNVLPRLLYPIQMIPVVFSKRVLKSSKWMAELFHMEQKAAKVVLRLTGSKGGLDLPNIRTYQLGAHLRNISHWITKDVSSVWLDVETNLSKYPLQDVFF